MSLCKGGKDCGEDIFVSYNATQSLDNHSHLVERNVLNDRFVDEIPFILKDEEYELKYKIELKYVVQRARSIPRALFAGYKVCLLAHLLPPGNDLSAIVRSSGGDVSITYFREFIFVWLGSGLHEAEAYDTGFRCHLIHRRN